MAFVGGYHTEIGLMARHARDRGYSVQLIAANSMGTEEFRLIAGAARLKACSTLTLLTPSDAPKQPPSPNGSRASGYEPEGYTLYAYAAVQVWAQAAEKAGSLELEPMIAALRENQFDTVLGPIDFDEKGDLAVQNPVWWTWRGGKYMPLEEAAAMD